jgi:hypothetical protein
VRARVGDSDFNATARVVEAQAEAALHKTIQALSKKKYGWGNGLVVEITPAR